jgi:hypothetical protein
MKFSATILTDQIDADGEIINLTGVYANGEIPIMRRFGALRNDVVGHASISNVTPIAVQIEGDIDKGISPALYAAPGGYIEATEMRDGVQVITKFRITEISLTTHHIDPHVPPIELGDDR